MFTGIVQGTAKVIAIDKKERFQTHVLKLQPAMLSGLEIGASVAHNGCCLTVTQIDNDLISFDLMQETLAVTNLGLLDVADSVNIERAARFGDEIGGHSMSGHINSMTEICDIESTANNCTIWFSIPAGFNKYILRKGYIGLDGCSLTIGDVEEQRFNVHLIPETLQRTLFGSRKVGEKVNLEIDPQTQAIVDTVERVLAQRSII
ncbi:riboflavin synthase subunit alpha [Photobacterium makurazakiensis]|uniref:riboflavin synthase subunit alpha n=1 Tax=Photobacterium makurazakiensis TaxID=2910234 RepID=UPI003D0A284C